MKFTPVSWSHVLPALAGVLWVCSAGRLPAQLTINYDFTPGAVVTDNGQLSVVTTLGGLAGLQGSYTNVAARLNLTTGNALDPMYLGDLYSSLTFGTSSETQRIGVLLNRPGRDTGNPFGSALGSLNVTLDDSVAGTNVFAAGGNGTFNADGRLGVDPNGAAVAFAAGANGLAALNGAGLASNRVSLLVSDSEAGGTATLSGWGVSITGTAASTGSFTPGANASISDTGSGSINNVGANLITTGASGGSLSLNVAGTTTFTGPVTGTGGITKTGGGTVVLSNTSNSYSGGTTITGGTLLLGANGVLPDSGSVTLSGGRLAAGDTGRTETAGTLSLTASSVIDMGNGTSRGLGQSTVLTFANTDTATWSNISVWNWIGTFGAAGGEDRLIFTSHTGGDSLTGSQVQFYSDNGITMIGSGGAFMGTELVPVPEVGAVFGVLGLLAPLAWRERRHWMRCREARG